MNEALVILSLGVQTLTLVTLVLALLRMVKITTEARAARVTLANTTARAETASTSAAVHAAEASRVVVGMAADIKELTVNTNSLKDALVAATAEASDAAGEKRGIAIGVAQESKRDKT